MIVGGADRSIGIGGWGGMEVWEADGDGGEDESRGFIRRLVGSGGTPRQPGGGGDF